MFVLLHMRPSRFKCQTNCTQHAFHAARSDHSYSHSRQLCKLKFRPSAAAAARCNLHYLRLRRLALFNLFSHTCGLSLLRICVCVHIHIQSIIQIPEKIIHPLRLDAGKKSTDYFFAPLSLSRWNSELSVLRVGQSRFESEPMERFLGQVQPSVAEVRHSVNVLNDFSGCEPRSTLSGGRQLARRRSATKSLTTQQPCVEWLGFWNDPELGAKR
jgi:hypothetical protein